VDGPVLVLPGGGEIIGDAPDRRVEILSDQEPLAATWSRFGPHREGADLHVHRLHTDVFYVLGGELTVRLGVEDRHVAVPAGTLARVPPLVVHGFANVSDAEVRYLNFHAPGLGFADYLRALRDGRAPTFDQYPPGPDQAPPTADAVIGEAATVTEEIAITVTQTDDATGEVETLRSVYVLEGEMTLTTDGRALRAIAGSWVQVPGGMPHALAAAGGRPARFVDIRTPG
jgi:quercetin dioxygenase-like cupin family protein